MMKTVRLFTAGGRTVIKSSPITTSLKFKAAARTTTSTSSGPAAPASGAFFEMQRLQIAAHVNVQMTLHSVGPHCAFHVHPRFPSPFSLPKLSFCSLGLGSGSFSCGALRKRWLAASSTAIEEWSLLSTREKLTCGASSGGCKDCRDKLIEVPQRSEFRRSTHYIVACSVSA